MAELTPEEKQRRLDNLARARKIAADNRAAGRVAKSAPSPDPAAEEEIEEEEIEEVAPQPDAAAARRRRLLGDVDPEVAALFTDAELETIEREERETALAKQRKQALADVRAKARQNAEVEHDLIPANVLRDASERKRLTEPVRVKITLPNGGSGEPGKAGIRIDGRLFQMGREYTVTRAVAETMRDMHYKAWLNETRFRTLDQHKAGNSAAEVLAHTLPQFEVV